MSKHKLFTRSMRYMGKRMYLYLFSILGMSISFAMFSVMGSLLMKAVVDMAQIGDYKQLLFWVIVIVAGGVISLLIYRVSAITYNVEAKRVYGKGSTDVLDEAIHLPFEYYEKHHSKEIISKITYDLHGMGAIYGSRFRRVVMPLLEVIVFLIPMMIFCWQLTICLVLVNLFILVLDMATIEPIHKVKKNLSEINKDMTGHLSDIIQGMLTIRLFAAGETKHQKFNELNQTFYKKTKSRISITSFLESINVGCDLLCNIVFVLLGVFFVSKGFTTLGAIAAIYTMYGKFSKQFLMLGKYIPELAACLANAENIFEFLDEKREPMNWYQDVSHGNAGGNESCTLNDNAITIENMSFSYNEHVKIFKNFSMNIKKGESVAIVGHSGCGKTTLSKILLGLYPVENGKIVINGKDFKNNSLAEIRKQIAYVPQDAYLFAGTIKENISYGMENASMAQIEDAARLANAHDFICKFSSGYDTAVSEGGTTLSGGQRQRIAIARAILKNAPIILMDEATSALDNESENLVNQALRNLQGKRTIIMIAHRPSTIELANRVVRLKNQC